MLAVKANLPAASVKDLIALANKQPGKLTFASVGVGTIVQMGGELFKYQTRADILHVPFKGGAPATIGLLSGEVDMLVNDLSAVLSHVKAGNMRALAAAHPTRLAPLPDVPTFAELGFPGIVSSTWSGIAVPLKIPFDIVARLTAAHAKVVNNSGYAAQLAELAMEPLTLNREQTSAFIKREIDKWQKVAAAAKVTLQ